MKIVAKYLGGSHSYGLNTASSDIDYRGVFLNEEISEIIGINRHEHQQKQGNGDDEVFTEFRQVFKLLRGGNTQAIEMLYNNNWIEISKEWQLVQSQREKLISSEKLFSCLRGYMQGEIKLANGERTGKLGGKRKEQIDKYGFSPKNFVQLFRLAWAGTIFFGKGYFPVNVFQENSYFGEMLMTIKTKPERYTKGELNSLAKASESELVKSFENRKFNFEFDTNIANELCLKVYKKILDDYQFNLKLL